MEHESLGNMLYKGDLANKISGNSRENIVFVIKCRISMELKMTPKSQR